MWKAAALARPGEWLCLLGSMLALVAFFLPGYTPPSGSSPPPGSLWDEVVFFIFQQPITRFGVVPWLVVALLLLLLSSAVLAVLALIFPAARWNSRETFLSLSSLTLMYYFFASLIYLYLYWLGAAISSTSLTDNPLTDTLDVVSVGAWLILVGLVLALIGGILLKRREIKAGG